MNSKRNVINIKPYLQAPETFKSRSDPNTYSLIDIKLGFEM